MCVFELQYFYYKLTVIFYFQFIKLQITIEVKAVLSYAWKLLLQAKLIKGQPAILTNRFVYFYLSSLHLIKHYISLINKYSCIFTI